PDELHVSGLSQTVSLALPHDVPAGSNASAGHEPAPSQLSATSQSPASLRHSVVLGSKLLRHPPDALHVSALSHTVSLGSPHAVPAGSKEFPGHAPAPSQLSATSQSPASLRHSVVLGSKLSRQLPEALHVSGLSQTVLLGSPHAVPAGSK